MAGEHEESRPPEAWAPLWRANRLTLGPIERFLSREAASGVVLMVTAALALAWANSPWAASYASLWHTPLSLQLGSVRLEQSLEWVVNDCLMAIFFFVVGLEIRRELHDGELSEPRRAALPLVAALGGMVAPALLAFAVVRGTAAQRGWAVPMATDIAFAVGVLTLLGKRVPPALRVLLLALAVIDDLGAILVIATVYSTGIQLGGLVLAAGALVVIRLLQGLGVRRALAYGAPALTVWVGFHVAGVHPTLAGVLVGLLTPVREWRGHSPNAHLTEALHPWVAFAIMPLFALANAGVSFGAQRLGDAGLHAAVGIALGLVVGKPLGIVAATLLLLRLRVVRLPEGLSTRHLWVLGLVAGIGFTMSLFLAQLAYGEHALLGVAKSAVLGASVLAALVGLAVGRAVLPLRSGGAGTEREAETSTER